MLCEELSCVLPVHGRLEETWTSNNAEIFPYSGTTEWGLQNLILVPSEYLATDCQRKVDLRYIATHVHSILLFQFCFQTTIIL